MNEFYLKFSINEHEINKYKIKKFKVGIQKLNFLSMKNRCNQKITFL